MLSNLFLKVAVALQGSTMRLREDRGSEIVSVGLIMGIVAIIVAVIFLGGNGHGGLKAALEGLGNRVEDIVNAVHP